MSSNDISGHYLADLVESILGGCPQLLELLSQLGVANHASLHSLRAQTLQRVHRGNL